MSVSKIGPRAEIMGIGPAASEVGAAVDDGRDAPLLPEPAAFLLPVGDVGAELAKLVIEMGTDDKKSARRTRQAEEQAQQSAERAQLAAMERAADAGRTAGMIGGFTLAASGLAVAASAGGTRAEQLGSEGASKMWEGGGKMASTLFQHEADRADRDAKLHEQLAGRHRRAADDARDRVQDAKALIDRAISFYKEYVSATAEAQRAALLRM